MNSTIPSTALILTAIMKETRDLEIARMLGWYRIPLRSAPKVIAVDYLAFYQTGAFGQEKWQVKYAAPVLGHELTTRGELFRDEPDHPSSHLEYYKIQIGSLIELPHPIRADHWKRITFLYTTGEYLNDAQTLKDLVVPGEQRQVLWQALRERACRNQEYMPDQYTHAMLDEKVLEALLGISRIN
jgi:hypothetical protein